MGSEVHVVILAAGQGTRMKSQLPKVLHQVAGRSLLEHVLRTANAVAPATVTVIVGHGADQVRKSVGIRPNVGFAVQEPQLGLPTRFSRRSRASQAGRAPLSFFRAMSPC